ncbi:MAG TPA: enoyl-ACP reductase FabI, partial [Acidimicrobiales bacterium]|nr:enoyl-ACP reductase FabI [Acidimicrobiales bacterium]
EVLELDVTAPDHVGQVAEDLGNRWGKLDGVLHAIGFAPEACLGGGFMDAGWDDVKVALEISAFSLKLIAGGFRGLMRAAGGASVVGLDFDATVAWPGYDWMGVAKAALESTSRYLARDLGADHIRVNLVAAGPIKTMAAKSIPGFSRFEEVWDERAPLGWSVTDSDPVARACVALLSDWFPSTTGEIVHVDGGYHAMGV